MTGENRNPNYDGGENVAVKSYLPVFGSGSLKKSDNRDEGSSPLSSSSEGTAPVNRESPNVVSPDRAPLIKSQIKAEDKSRELICGKVSQPSIIMLEIHQKSTQSKLSSTTSLN